MSLICRAYWYVASVGNYLLGNSDSADSMRDIVLPRIVIYLSNEGYFSGIFCKVEEADVAFCLGEQHESLSC